MGARNVLQACKNLLRNAVFITSIIFYLPIHQLIEYDTDTVHLINLRNQSHSTRTTSN